MKKAILKTTVILTIFILPQCQPLKKPVFYELEEVHYHLKTPIIKVGLTELPPNVEITCKNGMRFIKKLNENLIANRIVQALKIELKNGNKNEVYYVQLSAFLKKENAENFLAQWNHLYSKFPLRVFQSSQFYQVRIGPLRNRAEALELLRFSIANGIKDAWIVTEKEEISGEKRVNILVDGENVPLEINSDIFLFPSKQSELIRINGNPYRGMLEIKNGVTGLKIINILNIEDYLKGVVPLEMNPQQFNQIEALKAQAVSARTFALRKLKYREDKDYDICSSAKCQVYKGALFEHPLSNRAVEETAGEIAVWNSEPINALYSANCGGYTEDVENVFGGESVPYLRGTFCFHENSSEWVEEKTKDEILSILKKHFPITDIIDIYPIRRGISGRIIELRILTSRDYFDLRGFLIREIFGLRDLPLEILRETNQNTGAEKFVFRGRGKGHGIGFCQEGAYIMAKMKKNYKEILLHYYRDIDILKVMGNKNDS
jgi:stage II sporulation protein D